MPDDIYPDLNGIYESSPKAIAQRLLWGKSHYCDDDTLRYFKARICEVAVSPDRKKLGIIERLPLGGWDEPRKYRVVIFDAEGRIIDDRPAFSTKKPAIKALAERLA